MDLSIYDQRFMPVQFPDKLDPWHAARSCQSLNGVLAAEVFSRIPAPGELVGPVQVRLKFSAPDANQVNIDLWLQAKMAWRCQRCLEPVEWLQTVSRALLVMEPAICQARDTAVIEPGAEDELEVIPATRGELLSLKDLIEDELLLALPFAPRHEHCGQSLTVPDSQQETKKNPFAVLAGLQVRKTTD